MAREDLARERGRIVRVLYGHTSAETAAQVDDYPHGFVKRCKKRYWIEQATKGSQKGKYRLVTQTTHPDRGFWQKPKPTQYTGFMVLVEYENGHIDAVGLSAHPWVQDWLRFHNTGIWALLGETDRRLVRLALAISRRFSPVSWGDWDRLYALLEENYRTGDEGLSLEDARGRLDFHIGEDAFVATVTYVEQGGPDLSQGGRPGGPQAA